MHGFLLQVGWSCGSEAYDAGGLAARTCLVQHEAEVRNSVKKPSGLALLLAPICYGLVTFLAVTSRSTRLIQGFEWLGSDVASLGMLWWLTQGI